MNDLKFQAVEYADKISRAVNEVINIYTSYQLDEAKTSLLQVLSSIKESEKIKVAFIGQYTAGKSSIISALTLNKDIVIDADISTTEAKSYDWGGIYLTDTPGLYTEYREHDAVTKKAIQESDMLIYCITSDLFNEYTLKDFLKLALSDGYKDKMFLVINKMSKEDGEYDELVRNYTVTLNRSLFPNSLDEFEHVFIDVKDYLDGIEENDSELIEYSHFPDFIRRLNDFVKRKGQLSKLDTPVKAVKSSVDNVLSEMAENDESKIYYSLLNRLGKKVEAQRSRTLNECSYIVRKELNTVISKGYELSKMVGIEDIDFDDKRCEELIMEVCGKINGRIDEIIERNLNELRDEVEEVLKSDVAQEFFSYVNNTKRTYHFMPFVSKNFTDEKKRYNEISNIVEYISDGGLKLAVNPAKEGGTVLIKATEASGSQLHKAILYVGGKLGIKFKPWQAVNIAKNIGNVAKFAGPVMSVFSFILDVKEIADEESNLRNIERAQEEYKQAFVNIANDLEQQYSEQINNCLSVFNKTMKLIDEAKNNELEDKKKQSELTRKLNRQRKILVGLQEELFATK